MRTITLVLSGVLLLAGCGGQAAKPANAAPASAQASAPATAPTQGCTEQDTEELYVRALYDCGDTSVYVFNDSTAKTSWEKIADTFGNVTIKEGPTWLIVKN